MVIPLWIGPTATSADRSFLCRLSLMPRQVVADLLNISIATVETFKKEKQLVIA